MRVVVLNDHLYPDGGADAVALTSAEGLAALGVDTTLFVGDRLRADDATPRRAHLVCTGQRDLLHGGAGAAMQGLWNREAALALHALLRDFDPRDTVVHLHSWTKSLSSSVVRATQEAGFALICTLHEFFIACPNGMLFDHQAGAICSRRPMSLSCIGTHCDSRRYAHKLYRVARQTVQRGIGRMPDAIRDYISVSDYSARLLRPMLPPDARVHAVRNPIDLEPGPPVDVAGAHEFAQVGRIVRPKGQALFLAAGRIAGVPAVCVGDGDDRAALQSAYPEARFTGALDRAGVAAALRGARALVFPSIWHETQGLVVAEAAALGVPAIVSDACAAAEAVEHERTGLHFRGGDAVDLARALRRLHEDAGFAAQLGAEAHRRYWSDPPTPQAHAHALMAVYADILARRNAIA